MGSFLKERKPLKVPSSNLLLTKPQQLKLLQFLDTRSL